MPRPVYVAGVADFPVGFLWGSATAAHQVEGGCTGNDWWAWEQARGLEPSGPGIDQWNRYDEDVALLASLGQNAHRISLEWSRIEPSPGVFSDEALDHYAGVLDSLARHGLTAFVTLHHFTLPAWFAERGGWLADDAVELFARYVAVVVARLGTRMPWVCTVNEPQIVALMGYAVGVFPPGVVDHAAAVTVNAVLMQAHRAAVAEVRSCAARVGVCLQMPVVEPLTPADTEVADLLRWLMVDSHLDDLRAGGDVGDFVGLQYYTRLRVDSSRPDLQAPPPAGAETTQMGWEVFPAGFGASLRVAASAGLPVVVTENGIATADDAQRVRFLRSHLAVLAQVLAEGVDVRGYLHWSAFDNFEWAHGYAPTFGLVGIDRADGLRRVVRRSAELYGDVARSGSLAALEEG